MTLQYVPIIDLAPYFAGTPEGKLQVARAVDQACRDIGFLVITNHQIPTDLVERVSRLTRQFFALPLAEKRKVDRPSPDMVRGYSAVAEESLSYSLEEAAPGDLKESFSIGPSDVPDEPYYRCAAAGPHFAPNVWPSGIEGFEQTYREYFAAMSTLAQSLMRIFAGDRVRAIMERLKLPEGEPIEAGMVTRSIETAQRKVEGRNFDIRKQLLEYDDVANDQRKVLYSQRNDVLEAASVGETVQNLRDAAVIEMFNVHVPPESVEEQWDVPALQKALEADWHVQLPLVEMLEKEANLTDDDLRERVVAAARDAYQAKVDQVGQESWSQFERSIMLQAIDTHWREHLSALDYLRQGIHLRGYAQKNPKQEYKREAFELFSGMLDRIRDDVVRVLMTVRVQSQEQVDQAEAEAAQSHVQNVQYHHSDYDEALAQQDSEGGAQPVRNVVPKVGRNDPCPCGSGKKYKNCHGKLA